MRIVMSAALVAISLAWAGETPAECVCRCIDGELGVICVGPIPAQPVCAPRICPATQPSVAPTLVTRAPPPGTTQCRLAQVLNPQTGRYEWVELCR